VLGCSDQQKTLTLRLSAHVLPGCPPSTRAPGGGGAEPTLLELTPLGDFASAPRRLTSLHAPPATELDLPPATRALDARLEDEAGAPFIGYAERGASAELPLLLWPAASACPLHAEADAFARLSDGRALGYSAEAHTLLLVGGNAGDLAPESVAARAFDSGTGEFTNGAAASAASEPLSLAEPRAFASVTSFGGALLVAGGENPLRGGSAELAPPSGSAEVYDPRSRRFEATRIELTLERARHSAVVLASGDTLLVGGRGPRGTALNALELVSPRTRSASIAGLYTLEVQRLFPVVLLLDDQRVFIADGTGADGAPQTAIEWLSPDARSRARPKALPPNLPRRHDRAFAAVPGGGVLAVGGCEPAEIACGGDCRAGCPPSDGAGNVKYDAFWISPEGQVIPLEFDLAAPRPVLLGGADGAPLLSTGASHDTTLYRFDPWRGRFEPTQFTLESPPRAGLVGTTLDAQAFAWLAEDEERARLFGMRWGTREHFALDSGLVSGAGNAGTELDPPFPLVPDRPTHGTVLFGAPRPTLVFDAESEVTVYVAAADYANFRAELWAGEGAPPRVVVGTSEFGGADCPWPSAAETRFRVQRTGDSVVLSSGMAQSTPCAGPSGRVRLGVRRGDGELVLQQLSIERLPL
jgi:hypothetical protein